MKPGVWRRSLLTLVPLLPLACGGGGAKPSITQPDGSSPSALADGGATSDGEADHAGPSDAGISQTGVDAMDAAVCVLPAPPADPCSALPTGKVTPCSQDGGQPSQTGYLEIDSPGAAPIYVCATSWSPDPSIGYIFGQPATFLSDPQGCCGGAVVPTASPMVPDPPMGSLGAPHIPSHIKPQELTDPGSGLLRTNPFAIAVTDTTSGAAAVQAMSTWLSWAGDGKPHAAPDGTGAYYFEPDLPINYVILETSAGFPVLVIGPEINLTPDDETPLGHPALGVCPAGGGAVLAMIGGEVHGTLINNHSGRYDYGPWVTPEALNSAAQLFNCMGIHVTQTNFTAPKS